MLVGFLHYREERAQWKAHLVSFLCGGSFAGGLVLSGMTQRAKVVNFLALRCPLSCSSCTTDTRWLCIDGYRAANALVVMLPCFFLLHDNHGALRLTRFFVDMHIVGVLVDVVSHVGLMLIVVRRLLQSVQLLDFVVLRVVVSFFDVLRPPGTTVCILLPADCSPRLRRSLCSLPNYLNGSVPRNSPAIFFSVCAGCLNCFALTGRFLDARLSSRVLG